jgi:hypothetical protein
LVKIGGSIGAQKRKKAHKVRFMTIRGRSSAQCLCSAAKILRMRKMQICHVVISLQIRSAFLTFLRRTATEFSNPQEVVMATTTLSPATIGAEAKEGHGLLRRIYDHMIRAREAEAKRRTARALWPYTDEGLKHLGLTRDELRRWHSGAND